MLYGYPGFDSTFDAFGILFFVCFALVIGTFVVVIVQNISTWNKNNRSPRLSVPAEVVAKRTDISYHRHAHAGHSHGAHMHHTTSSTSYYTTFQVESGDRLELSVSGEQYGMLVEGDTGKLTFQGTRFLSFDRA